MSISDEEGDENLLKRVKANDPTALSQMACVKKMEGDYKSAVEYLTILRAIALGDVEAHFVFHFCMLRFSRSQYDGGGMELLHNKYLLSYEELFVLGIFDMKQRNYVMNVYLLARIKYAKPLILFSLANLVLSKI